MRVDSVGVINLKNLDLENLGNLCHSQDCLLATTLKRKEIARRVNMLLSTLSAEGNCETGKFINFGHLDVIRIFCTSSNKAMNEVLGLR